MTNVLKIAKYKDLLNIASGENDERLVEAKELAPGITAVYEKMDMLPYLGESIMVRESVAKKLALIDERLSAHNFHLKIVYGYRHPEVQRLYFEKRKAELSLQGVLVEELDEMTHAFVAVPDIAGHPTGGAVDVSILDKNGLPLDMGTGIADFADPEKIKTFAADLTEEQAANRKMLLEYFLAEGFAPFYGEWWHFSYGDKEWAFFYDKPASLYSSIELKM